MKNTNWKDIAELTGIAAIVASLVFVGLQMKQSHQIALAEIYQARTATVVEALHATAANPYILNWQIKAHSDRLDEIEPIEQLVAANISFAELLMTENSHYQYTLGYLPEEHWLRVRSTIKRHMQIPVERQLIEDAKGGMRESFRKVIEEIEREVASDLNN